MEFPIANTLMGSLAKLQAQEGPDADRPATGGGQSVMVGTMHLAKGLEFKAVAIMACDDDVLPWQERLETASDEAELEEVYDTERPLLYVACAREIACWSPRWSPHPSSWRT
jgi:superfamily I DNA/RNA helicase